MLVALSEEQEWIAWLFYILGPTKEGHCWGLHNGVRPG